MKKRKCVLFVFNGYADWEPALAIAGLNKYGDFTIESFSFDGKAIVTMGGLTVQPDYSMNQLDTSSIDLLMLPGGEEWESGGNTEIIPLLQEVNKKAKMIAAICGATIILGKMGLIDNLEHTSNALEYLQHYAPEYKGEANYINEPVVKRKNIITANGAAMIEFAHEIYQAFQIMDDKKLNALKELYKSGGMVNAFEV